MYLYIYVPIPALWDYPARPHLGATWRKTWETPKFLFHWLSSQCPTASACEQAQCIGSCQGERPPKPVSITSQSSFSSGREEICCQQWLSPCGAQLVAIHRGGFKASWAALLNGQFDQKMCLFHKHWLLGNHSYISLLLLIAIKDYGEAMAQAERNRYHLQYIDPGENFLSLLKGAETGAGCK